MPSRAGRIKSKGLITAVKAAKAALPINQQFRLDLAHAIEEHEMQNRRDGSNYYTPSSMTCQRGMYYKRVDAPKDDEKSGYQGIGMAATGTGRHTDIQTVLEAMPDMGFKWKYWDVEEFLQIHRWPIDLCKNLQVVEKHGGETLIRDDVLKLSFKCDGILEYLDELPDKDPFFLFEFKNQISFKAAQKSAVDEEHYAQVRSYCAEFELGKALVTYENRDQCELHVPELFIVSEKDKQDIIEFLLETEGYVARRIVPPCECTTKKCRYCKYKTQCQKDR